MRSIVNVIVVYLWLGNIVAAQPQSQRPQGERITILTSIQLPIAAPRTEVLTALPGAAQEQISKSPVPVLLLPNVGEFTAKRIMVENVYYAAFFSDGKQTISIEGSRLAYRYSGQHLLSDKAEKDSIRSTQGFITDSEGIWTASWKEFGAAYFISLECAEEKDDRCRSGDYVLRLANSLVYVGGGRAASETQGPEVPSLGEERREIKKFSYHPPGELLPGSGTGRHDETVYAPGIRFPIEKLPAYANSQVWNPGGKSGPPGGDQCDPNNYSYPWWDNFCETRGWKAPMCPLGHGHQGQDIRPSTCDKDKHATVSVEDGTVTSIGDYSVSITDPHGTRYNYLHMSSVTVHVGDKLKKGDRIALVSNRTATTIHLHFEIMQHLDAGFLHVPPYMSLVRAYEQLP